MNTVSVDPLPLPARTEKPRVTGITAINDTGVPLRELEGILEDFAPFVDIAKLGIGSALVTPRLKEKIALYRRFGVEVYFGGTLFEKYYQHGRLNAYFKLLRECDINWIEVSNGTVDLSLEQRLHVVRDAATEFTVVGEVGCKDAEKIMPPSLWIRELAALLEAGCRYVITEGRDSGTAGVYRANGEIRTGLISDVVTSVDASKIIFEAPKPQGHMFFINLLGANVNLGNVAPRELLLLESERRGLRSETLFMQVS